MSVVAPNPGPLRLPASLPLFPLTGVLLLPRGRLPLNVFEPRYLAMTDDALASGDRMIGMIQPADPMDRRTNPALFRTGCAGRITAFIEEDGRYQITLTGISRFDVVEEIATSRGYRRIIPDYSRYPADQVEEPNHAIDRNRLVTGLKSYFKLQGLSADWPSIEATPDEKLITSLAMICPFGPVDKQTLLQAEDLAARTKVLIGLVEAALLSAPGSGARH